MVEEVPETSDALMSSIYDINFFNNLVDSLPAQFKLICDLAEGMTGRPHLQNIIISIFVGSWARSKWTPLPTRD